MTMTLFLRTFLIALLFAGPGHAAGLPDTGQDTCYNGAISDTVPPGSLDSIARDAGTHPRQDCRYGRDPAAIAGMITKTGGGAKGFDYTKIANNGSTLPASTPLGTANTAWGCTRDNVTGLTWEVKTSTNSDLRYSGHTYTWYNTDSSTNGGNAGSQGGNTCNATLPSSLCNTQDYVVAVNLAQLCTYSDWRVPTPRELFTLLLADGSIPAIEPTYFTNTIASDFWSGSSFVPFPANAWSVRFVDGSTGAGNKAFGGNYVRLVRGGQF